MDLPRISDFDILEKLGAGNYATVYKSRHKKFKTYNAIKFVEMASLSGCSKENLITEIRLLRSLNHKHIVTLQDFFWDDKNIYIVLEYCNAGNLSTFIRSRKSLPENTCKYFLRQLASALQYMRKNDISHFDLKPQNLLLTRINNFNYVRLKVADFGFAQHLKLGEMNHELRGSPLYMAPEILCKQQYDAKADLWSTGVILYECLFGRAPYSSKTLQELLTRITSCEKILIPSNTNITTGCEDLLSRLLKHDPFQRISFNDFFDHQFIDLNTFPCDETLQKAIQLVSLAVKCDEECDYGEAYYLYCSSLQYFIPLITDETDATKRLAIRNRVLTYLKRAEEIKNFLIEKEYKKARASQLTIGNTSANSIVQILDPQPLFTQLYALSNSNPELKGALDIGRQGELYLYERKFPLALTSFTTCLGTLVPFLNKEPKGERQILLAKQINIWMKEAESIKSIFEAKEIDEEERKLTQTVRSCCIQ